MGFYGVLWGSIEQCTVDGIGGGKIVVTMMGVGVKIIVDLRGRTDK